MAGRSPSSRPTAWSRPSTPGSPAATRGASAILHRTTERAVEVAERQGVGTAALLSHGIVDRIIPELPDAADEGEAFLRRVGTVLEAELGALLGPSPRSAMASADAATEGSVWHDTVRRVEGGVNRFHRYYCASPGWSRLVQTTLVPAVLEGTELDRRVLEIGPGPGLTTEILAGVAPADRDRDRPDPRQGNP